MELFFAAPLCCEPIISNVMSHIRCSDYPIMFLKGCKNIFIWYNVKNGGFEMKNTTEERKKKKEKRNWTTFDLTKDNLNKAYNEVCQDHTYGTNGGELELIENVLKTPSFQKNTDVNIVAMKIALIDVTNSTHLHQHKEKINLHNLAKNIVAIKELDELIEDGDPKAVEKIAACSEKINLFSFASKYCFYHNTIVYKKDSYAKFDTLVKGVLPLYLEKKGICYHGRKITSNTLETMRKNKNYKDFNNLITEVLEDISVENKRAKFDYMMWHPNRPN
jgi:hypothetical protein